MLARKSEGYTALSTSVKNLIDSGRLDMDRWVMGDWLEVLAQMESLERTAKVRPNFQTAIDADVSAMLAVLNTSLADRKPATQTSEKTIPGQILSFFLTSNANIRSTLSEFGSVGEKAIIDHEIEAEKSWRGLTERVNTMLNKSYANFSSEDVKRLGSVTEIQGVTTTGWERLGRLLMWGTDTGRQRVLEDLRLAGVADPDAFVKIQMQDLSEAEVNFLNAMWGASDIIWQAASGAARRVGHSDPKALPPRSFEVTVGGKPVTLDGGYASVPYKGYVFDIEFIDQSTGEMANVALGFFNERLSSVRERRLDLSLDAQYQSMLSHIRTAAFLPAAKHISGILSNADLRAQLDIKFGKDWLRRLTGHVRFTFNGLPPEGRTAGLILSNMTAAVYAFNPLTAVKQPFGVISSASHPDAGWKATLSALWSYIRRGPILSSQMATNQSAILRDRLRSPDADFAVPQSGISDSKLAKYGKAWRNAGTWMMRRAQFVADVVTWDAAHAKALSDLENSGLSNDEITYEARRRADKVLHETQGSAWRTETAVINQGHLGQLATFSGKWMINYSNFLFRSYKAMRLEDTAANRKKFANAVFTGLFLSSTAMFAVGSILRPRDDELPDLDASDFAVRIGLDVVSSPMWWARAAVPVAYDSIIEGRPSLQSVVALDMFKRSAEAGGMQLHNLMVGDEVTIPKLIGGLIGTGALLLPLPVVQSKRLMDAAASDPEAGYEAWVAAVFGWDKTPARR